MSAPVSELIGRIINPPLAAPAPAKPRTPAAPPAPLHVLIGGIIEPRFPAPR